MDDTFDLLPLHMDPATKAITAPSSNSSALAQELSILNATHKMLQSADTPHNIPPPPVPLNPKRSAAITKMREQGNAAIAKRSNGHTALEEALRCYSFAIEMAVTRPPWEPSTIVRDEVGILMSNRAQAHIGMQNWPEGAVDAETAVDMKQAPGQGKAWWRRGKCLLEMGRLEEARKWVGKALEVETGEGAVDLLALKKQIDERFEVKDRKGSV